jgi:hypothetical protein
LDDEVEIVFRCPKRACLYEMCHDCLKKAFEDASGANVKECPSCKTPTARSMLESLCGVGAVREVENELRTKVAYELEQEHLRNEKGKAEMKEHKDKAQILFKVLSEQLNMCCPRCNMVFDDFDGCNALTCANRSCKAAICAICLKDCGSDAHAHVTTYHGALFDKSAFYKAKAVREAAKLNNFIDKIENEPFEVKELVKIEYEKLNNKSNISNGNRGYTQTFLAESKAALQAAVKSDRCSLLYENCAIRALQRTDISPRNMLPEDYKLTLQAQGGSSTFCEIKLQAFQYGRWEIIPLPDITDTQTNEEPYPEPLLNLRATLRCGIIAFQGALHLYQTRTVSSSGDRSVRKQDDSICIKFQRVNVEGELVGEEMTLSESGFSDCEIIGLNQNFRLMMLEKHAAELDVYSLCEPIKHFVGDGQPQRLLQKIDSVPPSTFDELNSQQKIIAHPLRLLTAKEVAGPPGSGKTKTITEVIRGILDCSDYDVMVLSERNGAIDAIAQKIADDCLTKRGKNKYYEVANVRLWNKVLAFGSQGSMGESAKLFTFSEKLKYVLYLVIRRFMCYIGTHLCCYCQKGSS